MRLLGEPVAKNTTRPKWSVGCFGRGARTPATHHAPVLVLRVCPGHASYGSGSSTSGARASVPLTAPEAQTHLLGLALSVRPRHVCAQCLCKCPGLTCTSTPRGGTSCSTRHTMRILMYKPMRRRVHTWCSISISPPSSPFSTGDVLKPWSLSLVVVWVKWGI